MKGDFWMKTRKLAAKALSVAVVATTVSGYAMAGDHSITADPSVTVWCNKAYKTEVSGGAGANNNGSCSSSDFEVEFSGKLGGGWSYFFEMDPDKSGATASWISTVSVTKDLGNGLSASFGDTGDGSRESLGGHWDINDLAGGNGEGGAKLDYSKGALSASAVYGAKAYTTDKNDSSISVGGDYKIAGAHVGFSYHTTTSSEQKKYHAQTQDTSGFVLSAGWANKSFAVGFDMTSSTSAELSSAEGNGTAKDKVKNDVMEINAATLTGAFRGGFSYTQVKNTGADNDVDTDDYVETTMTVQGRWYPAGWDSTHMRVTYKSYGKEIDGTAQDGSGSTSNDNYTQMSVSINNSVSIL